MESDRPIALATLNTNKDAITSKYKEKVREAMIAARESYGGTDASYAKTLGINPSVYSQIKQGKLDRVLKNSHWLRIGGQLGVVTHKAEYKIARTRVYDQLEDSLHECKD